MKVNKAINHISCNQNKTVSVDDLCFTEIDGSFVCPEIRGGRDDVGSSCSGTHLKLPLCLLDLRAAVYSDSGHVRLRHRTPGPFDKNKEITAAWLSSAVFCMLQFSWLHACWRGTRSVLVFKKEVAGLHPLIVLPHKRDHIQSIIQWKNHHAVLTPCRHGNLLPLFMLYETLGTEACT